MARGLHDECGFVALAPVWNWSKVRAIGLDEKSVGWNDLGSIADVLRLGKTDVARERDHAAQRECTLRVFHFYGETVEYRAQSVADPMLLEQPEAIIPRVL